MNSCRPITTTAVTAAEPDLCKGISLSLFRELLVLLPECAQVLLVDATTLCQEAVEHLRRWTTANPLCL